MGRTFVERRRPVRLLLNVFDSSRVATVPKNSISRPFSCACYSLQRKQCLGLEIRSIKAVATVPTALGSAVPRRAIGLLRLQGLGQLPASNPLVLIFGRAWLVRLFQKPIGLLTKAIEVEWGDYEDCF